MCVWGGGGVEVVGEVEAVEAVELGRPCRKVSSVQPVREQLAGLDGHRRELGRVRGRLQFAAVDDVADGVNVRHIGLLVDGADLAVSVDRHAGGLEAHAGRASVTPDRQQNRVELIGSDGAVFEGPGHLLLAALELLDGGRNRAWR